MKLIAAVIAGLLASVPVYAQNVGLDLGLPVPVAMGTTATGSSQSDAILVRRKITVFSTVPSGSGAVLPSTGASGVQLTIFNKGANALLVYPAPGGQIDSLGVNVPLSVAAGLSATFNNLDGPGPFSSGQNWTSQAASSTFSGGTVTSAITLPGNPSQALQAAPKQYVDALSRLVPANNLSDVNDAPTARTNIGLPLGTSGATVPLLNGTNTWSNSQNLSGGAVTAALSSAANLVINPGSTSNLINFKNGPSGASVLQVAGNVAVITQLQLPGRAWSGGSISANAGLYENSTWTGTSGNTLVAPHLLQMTEGITAGTSELDAYNFHTTATAGFSGGRSAMMVVQDVTGAPAVGNMSIVAISSKANVSVNLGGTDTTTGGSAGFVYAENPVAHTSSGATNIRQVVGSEIDVWTETGSSMMDRMGEQIVITAAGVGGVRDDIGWSLNNGFQQTSGQIPWATGISFGRQGGYFPIATTGTIMAVIPHTGETVSTANGIDFSAATFTGNVWNDGKTILSGAGQLQMSKMTASASAPGAGKMRFEVVAGTAGGSCKLVAYAGTSTTASVVLDNVGSGC